MKSLTLSQLCHLVTVEPIILMHAIAGPLIGPAYSAMVYDKICQQHFSAAICDNLSNASLKKEEDIVQTEASHWYFYSNLAFEIPSIIVAFYYGVLSDNVSRKVALTLPLIGAILAVFSDVMNAVFMDAHVGFCLVTRVVSGMFGGWIAFYLATFSYLSVISDEKSRSVRIGIVEGCGGVGFAIGLFSSGYILDNTSYTFVFSLGTGLYVIGLIYTLVIIHDPQTEKNPNKESVKKALLNSKHIKDSIICVFQRRNRRRRAFILVLLLTLIFKNLGHGAMGSLSYLFLRRQPLSWSQTTYGIYSGYSSAINSLFLLTAFPLLKKKYHIRDTTMIFVSSIGTMFGSLLFGSSIFAWMIFLVPLVHLSINTIPTCIRSMLSQMVEKKEMGKVFAAMGVAQSATALMSHVIYNNLYPLTLDTWVGWCFVLGSLIDLLSLPVVGWLHITLKKTDSYDKLSEEKAKSGDVGLEIGNKEVTTPQVV